MRDSLFCPEAPEGSGGDIEPAEGVAGPTGAQHRKALGNRHNIADAGGRQFEFCSGLLSGEHGFHASVLAQSLTRLLGRYARGQVDGGKRAQGAVVHHIGIGYGQDDPRGPCTQPGVKPVLNVSPTRIPVHCHSALPAVCCV